MFLYFNGDSHTEGAGLTDHIFVPGCPADSLTQPTPKNKLEWLNIRYEIFIKNPKLASLVSEENKKFSYTGRLGKILNAEVWNNAMGGSSIFGTYTRTVRDLQKFSETGNIPNFFFIGLTTLDRIPLINKPEYQDERKWITSIMPWMLSGYKDKTQSQEKYQEYARYYWASHTDEDMLTFYLYHCLSIKNAIKSMVGKDTIFLNTSDQWEYTVELVKNTKSIIIKELWDILKFDEISHREHSLSHFGLQHGFAPCGHYTQNGHIEYAKHLAKKYFNIVVDN